MPVIESMPIYHLGYAFKGVLSAFGYTPLTNNLQPWLPKPINTLEDCKNYDFGDLILRVSNIFSFFRISNFFSFLGIPNMFSFLGISNMFSLVSRLLIASLRGFYLHTHEHDVVQQSESSNNTCFKVKMATFWLTVCARTTLTVIYSTPIFVYIDMIVELARILLKIQQTLGRQNSQRKNVLSTRAVGNRSLVLPAASSKALGFSVSPRSASQYDSSASAKPALPSDRVVSGNSSATGESRTDDSFVVVEEQEN